MNQKPNDYQIAGNHYQTTDKYQLWDLFADIELNFFLANAVKYIYRCKNKNGLEDLKKAQHYTDKFFSLTIKKQLLLLNNKFDEAIIRDFLNKEIQLYSDQYTLIYLICNLSNNICNFSTNVSVLKYEKKHIDKFFQYLNEELERKIESV